MERRWHVARNTDLLSFFRRYAQSVCERILIRTSSGNRRRRSPALYFSPEAIGRKTVIASAEDRKQFLTDYTKIRHEEGRGSENCEYYRALPYADLTGHNSAQWRIRACTFEFFK